jgi:biotin carboxyl carrier protein
LTLGRDAHAIVGAPLTPISVAGVARRTTYRAVVATSTTTAAATLATAQQQAATAQQQSATAQQQAAAAQKPPAQAATPAAAGTPAVGSIVNTLPAGCKQEAKGGVEYQRCGNVYYRAAFQGNSLVYVVQQP